MNIAVIGSRTLVDYNLVEETLLASVNPEEDTIISGGATGADQLGEHFANEYHIKKIVHKPDYKQYGKAAPFIRNQLIIDDADYVIAFWDGKSKGTADTILKAQKKGIDVLHIQIGPNNIEQKKLRKKYTPEIMDELMRNSE